jgi:flagellar biosynthesis/type III secretory pathway M-ring protein FliF/YscJ
MSNADTYLKPSFSKNEEVQHMQQTQQYKQPDSGGIFITNRQMIYFAIIVVIVIILAALTYYAFYKDPKKPVADIPPDQKQGVQQQAPQQQGAQPIQQAQQPQQGAQPPQQQGAQQPQRRRTQHEELVRTVDDNELNRYMNPVKTKIITNDENIDSLMSKSD